MLFTPASIDVLLLNILGGNTGEFFKKKNLKDLVL